MCLLITIKILVEIRRRAELCLHQTHHVLERFAMRIEDGFTCPLCLESILHPLFDGASNSLVISVLSFSGLRI